ncbi:MAG: hypothetical protein IJJ94_09175 [Bacteroidaceae bacterium]|nr:hypothetical protein [Bacteroidaceae bacterium]
MKRLLLLLVAAVAALTAHAQEEYYGQQLVIHQTSGDSLLTELVVTGLAPRLVDGEVVWYVDISSEKPFGIKDVESIDFLTPEQSLARAREGLMEFYRATDGDNWTNNENWGSDKPISEWAGVVTNERPYVFTLNLGYNNLKGELPSRGTFAKMGPTSQYNLFENQLSGPIPEDWTRNLSLWGFIIDNNQMSGTIPTELFEHPSFGRLEMSNNNFTGSMPAGMARLMDDMNMLNISGNDFSGDVPLEIVEHPRFNLCWDVIIPQQGHLNVPTIPGYRFPVVDLSGNHLETTDVYANNLYTLIFNYSSAQDEFTSKLKLAYEQYKSKGFEVLGMAPGDAEQVNEYLHENGINWLNLDPESFKDYIGRYYMYINYINLIDRNGNVVFSSIMDDNGKMEDTGWMGSTRDQQVFDVLAEKFGAVDFTPYASTDYSRDGEVVTLQKATAGKGVDIVFVGNCFVDKDMEPGGKYEQKMRQAMEQFFAYEPYTSLRDRFNVYAVKAVSQNAEMYEGCKQAIATDADALEYAKKVTTLIPDRPMRVNIVYNALNAGRSFTFMYDDNSYTAFMFTGVNDVLVHEAGGHGVGRLYDEYVEESGSTASPEVKDYYERMWTENGRGANIDMHADVSQTRWARLAADSRYAAEELGAYEGSGTYNFGIYRPTPNSMMRFNNAPFNAPSREAIYKYVMQESEGPSWQYDYETFVSFDAKGRAEFAAYAESQVKAAKAPKHTEGDGAATTELTEKDKASRPLPPVLKKGSWRDALENPTAVR